MEDQPRADGRAGLPRWLHAAVETCLDARVLSAAPARGGDIAAAYRVDTTAGRVFAKATPGPAGNGTDRAAVEAADLRWLADAGALRLPEVLGHALVDDAPTPQSVLLLEWIDEGSRSTDHDAQLGAGLAALHAAGAPSFGSVRPGGFGSLSLSNEPCDSWAEFFSTRRLVPLVDAAVDRGLLGAGELEAAAAIAHHLSDPAIGGPAEAPARVHGDLWSGNAMVDDEGHPVLIDPAAHGAHREIDLAMMLLFGGFGPQVFEAYHEAHPLAAGWEQRCRIWQIAPLCVHALLFGGSYVAATATRLAEIHRRCTG